ncbi:hypothetical protein F4821DRAFT_276110 [Hypoxylon rubiginosum]|uniref:Uncharacterized protein n=1 Tax=Hypoxylon rubiginosum TaxID=110542 RepID=A0ACC0D9N0_9PEZI|nr:hypothetical protein F4821DRAFT_276110 [Hypoxylon rubiginosum]
MQVLRGIPLDVTFDALNGRSRLEDTFTKMPSLAVLRRSVQVFITDAKDPRGGDRQTSSKCTGIRDLIRRPREQIRKTHQTRTQKRLRKSKALEAEGRRRRETNEKNSGAAGHENGDGNGDGDLGSGSGAADRREGTSTGTTGTTKNAGSPKAIPAATTVQYPPKNFL